MIDNKKIKEWFSFAIFIYFSMIGLAIVVGLCALFCISGSIIGLILTLTLGTGTYMILLLILCDSVDDIQNWIERKIDKYKIKK